MSQSAFIPRHVAYPKVFVSKEVRRKINGIWHLDNTSDDVPLNVQLKEFVDSTGAGISMISNPNITSLIDEPDVREYYVGVTVMYVLPEEGTRDAEPGRDRVG